MPVHEARGLGDELIVFTLRWSKPDGRTHGCAPTQAGLIGMRKLDPTANHH